MAVGVTEWRRRKAERAPDPLLGDTPARTRSGADTVADKVAEEAGGFAAEARANGVVVARSAHARTANARVYFPVEDCVRAHFEASSKRWR
jgi:uncharacterized protein (DUF427 family)